MLELRNEAQKQLRHKSNEETSKLQYGPAVTIDVKRDMNKPSQANSPPNYSNAQKKKKSLKQVPSYIRTEMEILNRLQQINRNLKVSIKPKLHCDRPTLRQKCCEPAREGRDKRKAQGLKSVSKKDTNEKDAKDDHTEHKGSVQQSSAKAVTNTQPQAEKKQPPKQHQRKCTYTKKCEPAAQAKNARGLEQIMECMKPKTHTKWENCKCVQNKKPKVQGKISTGTEQASEAANATFFHAKFGHRRCKQHVAGTPKQDGKETAKPRRKRQHEQQQTAKQLLKGGSKADKAPTSDQPTKYEVQTAERTKKTGLASCFKCCAGSKTLAPADDDKNKAHKLDKEAHSRISHKTIIFGHKLRRCMRFLRPKGRQPTESELPDTASAIESRKQYEEIKTKHDRNKHDAQHDLLTTFLFPNPKQAHLKYVDKEKEYKKQEYKRRNQEIDTLSTSSLEEYFQRISERMTLEQKECDVRWPIKQTNGRTYANRKRATIK